MRNQLAPEQHREALSTHAKRRRMQIARLAQQNAELRALVVDLQQLDHDVSEAETAAAGLRQAGKQAEAMSMDRAAARLKRAKRVQQASAAVTLRDDPLHGALGELARGAAMAQVRLVLQTVALGRLGAAVHRWHVAAHIDSQATELLSSHTGRLKDAAATQVRLVLKGLMCGETAVALNQWKMNAVVSEQSSALELDNRLLLEYQQQCEAVHTKEAENLKVRIVQLERELADEKQRRLTETKNVKQACDSLNTENQVQNLAEKIRQSRDEEQKRLQALQKQNAALSEEIHQLQAQQQLIRAGKTNAQTAAMAKVKLVVTICLHGEIASALRKWQVAVRNEELVDQHRALDQAMESQTAHVQELEGAFRVTTQKMMQLERALDQQTQVRLSNEEANHIEAQASGTKLAGLEEALKAKDAKVKELEEALWLCTQKVTRLESKLLEQAPPEARTNEDSGAWKLAESKKIKELESQLALCARKLSKLESSD